ncbi:NAD(P)/FAD-dependent oxidoreductase [Tellurirhabdus bombi]|uniref:NAD(P)/FAD-dependent oxidoreductase n=1 Tax=Tellurirhabdus bombi TaxID=2907205 RepID=UPI001F1AF15A|nr:FAD-dependent oxidoreductase [Tellurirhabdus bombi]
MSADYLIVGQGVAGSVLAWRLHQQGKTVQIVGNPNGPAASLAAAGIFNPLTGKKLVRTWKADQLFPFLHQFYTELETALGASFMHHTAIYRPYRSIEEQNSYLAQTADPVIEPFVAAHSNDEDYAPFIKNPYGGLTVTQAGWIDTKALLTAVRAYFIEKGQFVEATFQYDQLKVDAEGVEWNGQRFRKVIFCEGPEGNKNPFFDWLPYNPVKGQVLDVEIEGYSVQNIVNQGIFILPYAENKCRVGATYTWHDLDWETTEDGKQFLEVKLRDLLTVPYRIIGQRAGIRPATKDRRPLIGLHPEHPAVAIFNGLGTKGVSLAPFFADQFADYLEGRKELELAANISRHFSLYYHQKKLDL